MAASHGAYLRPPPSLAALQSGSAVGGLRGTLEIRLENHLEEPYTGPWLAWCWQKARCSESLSFAGFWHHQLFHKCLLEGRGLPDPSGRASVPHPSEGRGPISWLISLLGLNADKVLISKNTKPHSYSFHVEVECRR